MIKLILNDTQEFEIISYSRTVYLRDNDLTAKNTGYCVVLSELEPLMEFVNVTITSFKIYHDEELIYDISDTEIYISTITEQLNNNKIEVSVGFLFPEYLTSDEN